MINLLLFAAGVLGILTQNLMKIDELVKKANGDFNAKQFFRMEWASIGLSVCVVLAALIGKEFISTLQVAGPSLALGIYAIGLAAQTVAYFFKGRAEKKFGA